MKESFSPLRRADYFLAITEGCGVVMEIIKIPGNHIESPVTRY